tara:strand:- start:2671 stop:3075 length:405 start_codon:yes stop_codon:yes gene_type:complete
MTELRLHPRIATSLMAEITNSAGVTLAAKIHDLSPGGLMLDGEAELKTFVFEGHDPDKDPLFHPIELEIRIQLPNQQRFFSQMRLLYIRRLSQSQYNLGFRYVALSSIHVHMMERYIFDGESTEEALNRAFNSL